MYILQVSICWALLYIVYKLFLAKETFFTTNRYYLLGSLILGLFLPLIAAYVPSNSTSQEVYQAITYVTVMPTATVEATATENFSWAGLLWMIYFIGVAVVGIRFFRGISRIINIYRSGIKKDLGNFVLVESTIPHLPFSFLNYVFLSKQIPLNKEIEQILLHEEIHVRQWHTMDILFAEVLNIFFWFNPFIHLYKKALKESHEFLADAYVSQEFNKDSYGQLLLGRSTSGFEVALAHQFFHSQIKKRIVMLYKEKSKRSAMFKYFTALPVFIGMLFIFSSNQKSTLKEKGNSSQEELLSSIGENKKDTENNPDINFEMSQGEKLDTNKSKVFKEVDEMPRFPGCENRPGSLTEKEVCARNLLFGYIGKNLKYPEQARKNGTEGTVIVQFTVSQNGNLEDLELVRSVGDGLGEEAIRIVKSMPKWVPGKLDGKDVAVQLTLPFMYKLDSEDKKASSKEQSNADETVYKVVEEMPRFSGCEDAEMSLIEKDKCAKGKLFEFIVENLVYPEEAKKKGIEGMAVIQFDITSEGKVTNGKIVRDPGYGTAEEALRVVNSMPDFIPGKQRGKRVAVQYTLPVKFALGNDDKK